MLRLYLHERQKILREASIDELKVNEKILSTDYRRSLEDDFTCQRQTNSRLISEVFLEVADEGFIQNSSVGLASACCHLKL